MPIIELYSSRNKKIDFDGDVYIYDSLSEKVLNQILQILQDIFEVYKRSYSLSINEVNHYEEIRSILCREYGMSSLSGMGRNAKQDIYAWFKRCTDIDKCLDFIELSFRYVEEVIGGSNSPYVNWSGDKINPEAVEEAINELNYRLKYDGIGYQYNNFIISRVDSEFIHSEVVVPMLTLLKKNGGYDGAIDEFLCAHQNYRHGDNKECLVNCLKSFESLMKSIHIKKGWDFDKKRATAKDLINGVLKNGLVPMYLQNQLSSLNSILESGIPTIRNKEAGHGQGESVTQVESHLCSYMLHITASNLLFLAECERNM